MSPIFNRKPTLRISVVQARFLNSDKFDGKANAKIKNSVFIIHNAQLLQIVSTSEVMKL